MPSLRERHPFALLWHWRTNIKKLIQSRAGDAARRRVHVDATSSSRQGDCPLCKSFGDFRKAIRRGSIDARTYARISSIAFEEECSPSQALHRLICVALEKYPLKRKSSFARFAGRWTAEEAAAFNELTQRTVDEED